MIEMYKVKIPGSRYILDLDNVDGVWVLKILLDSNVEAKTQVPNINKRNLHAKIAPLLKEVNIQLSPVQIDIMHKELTQQADEIFGESNDSQNPSVDLTAINNKIHSLETTISNLEKKIDGLTDRLSRLERLSPN